MVEGVLENWDAHSNRASLRREGKDHLMEKEIKEIVKIVLPESDWMK